MATGKKDTPGALSQEVAAILRAQLGRVGRAKLSQTALAEAAEMSQGQLSGVLSGKKHVDIEQLDRICWAAGLNFRDVIAEADKATADRFASKSWTTPRLVED